MDFIDRIYKEIGESDANQDVSDWLSVGYLPLNMAISGKYDGGLPVGRIIEIFGGESSGKTMLATMACIEAQRRGGLAMYLDFEHAFSIRRATQLGLIDDRTQWIYKQPSTAEEAFRISEFVANEVRKNDSKKTIALVYDSVAAMMTKEELEVGYDESTMKTRLSLASCLSTSLKKLAELVNNTNITLIFLNQTRSNVGVMFGDKEKTTGGNALKFYASARIKLSKQGKIKSDDGNYIIGDNVVAQVVKNKVFEPYREARYESNFKEGINLEASHINFAKDKGLLGDTKGWLEFKGGKHRAKDLEAILKADRAMYGELLDIIKAA
jgi:recombination protein RecA